MFCSGLSALVLHKVLKYQWKAKQNERLCIVIALPLYFFFFSIIRKCTYWNWEEIVQAVPCLCKCQIYPEKCCQKLCHRRTYPAMSWSAERLWDGNKQVSKLPSKKNRTRIAWNKFIPAWYQPRNEDHQQARNADLKISSTLNFQTPSYCESLKKSIPQIAFVSKYLAMNNEYR